MFIGLFVSCSSDNYEDDLLQGKTGFSFKVTGDITKTISGTVAYFATSVDPDIFGDDLNTTSFSAVDQGNGQVSFGITTFDVIGKGTYPVEFRLAPEAYNGYINFVEDQTVDPIYGPDGGTITLKSFSQDKISGSVDVTCLEYDSGKTIAIKGDFIVIRQ